MPNISSAFSFFSFLWKELWTLPRLSDHPRLYPAFSSKHLTASGPCRPSASSSPLDLWSPSCFCQWTKMFVWLLFCEEIVIGYSVLFTLKTTSALSISAFLTGVEPRLPLKPNSFTAWDFFENSMKSSLFIKPSPFTSLSSFICSLGSSLTWDWLERSLLKMIYLWLYL